jgi:DNA topoisomerase-1
MNQFGLQIADIRAALNRDLSEPGIHKQKLLALASSLLETGNIRVGSAKYVEENGTYGLTTLLSEHVRVEGSKIYFNFVGKEHVKHEFYVDNKSWASVFKELLKQKRETLFQYQDTQGVWRGIDGADISRYLKQISHGQNFTAKDFRTWQGTTSAAEKLIELGPPIYDKVIKDHLKKAVEYASSVLRNTPSIAKERYIYGLVLDSYANGAFTQTLQTLPPVQAQSPLSLAEQLVLELIKKTQSP